MTTTTPTSFASSARINPPNVLPILTIQQVWAGLQYKARNPRAFVPMITECQVIADHGDKLTRFVKFGDGPFVTEEITAFESTIVYFEMSTGTRITNLISYFEDDELLLTFTFANSIPGVKPGDSPTASELNKMIGGGVKHSIDVIRQLVKDGTLA